MEGMKCSQREVESRAQSGVDEKRLFGPDRAGVEMYKMREEQLGGFL